MTSDLLEAGQWEEQLDVQLAVVLLQAVLLVVRHQLHHRAEDQRLREAEAAVPVVDLDQLVVASLPAVGHRDTHKGSGHDLRSPPPIPMEVLAATLKLSLPHLSVSV